METLTHQLVIRKSTNNKIIYYGQQNNIVLNVCRYSTDTHFDEGTPFGWYMRLAINGFGICMYFFGLVCIAYVACCCLYIRACCKHFELMVGEWDELVSYKYDKKEKQINKVLSDQIKCSIQFQIKILE